MDNYQIYDEIGKGKYSRVFKGRQKKTIQYLAIKCVDKVNKNRVVNEVQVMNTFDHFNIIKFYNWYETGNHFWIILEYCCGGDLMTLLEQDKSLPEETCYVFGVDIIHGLQHIHSKEFLYCDLKPSNILLNGSGILKLCDFGLSRSLSYALKEEGQRKKRGTPCYMSPELFRGGKYSICSDLWAFGCVMYELATGSPPFTNDNFEKLVQDIMDKPINKLSNFSDNFNDLVGGLLRKDPGKRYGWEEVVGHPFFKGNLKKISEFEPQEKKNFETPKIYTRENVDIARLSLIVKNNLAKDSSKDSYFEQNLEDESEHGHEDFRNSNKNDQSIDFTDDFESDSEEQENGMFLEEPDNSSQQVKTPRIEEPESLFNKMESEEEKKKKSPSRKTGRNKRITPNSSHTITSSIKDLSFSIEEIVNFLFNSSDSSVKPIVGNPRIEKNITIKYDPNRLGFNNFSVDEVKEMVQEDLQEFLNKVFRRLVEGRSADKLNLLNYFEGLCKENQIANLILHSSFMSLFFQILKKYKNVNTKTRILSIFGVLIRTASIVPTDLLKYDIIKVLKEYSLEKNLSLKIRRTATACLGELLFYIVATKKSGEEEEEINKWKSFGEDIEATLLLFLENHSEEDICILNYIIKTIENILGTAEEYFQNGKSISVLMDLFFIKVPESGKFYNGITVTTLLKNKFLFLRMNTISCLSRITRINNKFSVFILNKIGHEKFLDILNTYSSVKILQNLLNILNVGIIFDHSNEIIKRILTDVSFVNIIMKLVKHFDLVLNEKSLLTVFLYMKIYPHFFIKIFMNDKHKFCNNLELLENKKSPSLSKILKLFIGQISSLISPILVEIEKDLKEGSNKNNEKKLFLDKSSNLEKVQVILQILLSPSISSFAINSNFIIQISNCLSIIYKNFSVNKSNSLDEENLSIFYFQLIFHIVESLSQQMELLIKFKNELLSNLLPVLLILYKVSNNDIRFMSLKIFTDILIKFLYDKSIYDSTLKLDENGKISNNETSLQIEKNTNKINNLVITKLFPIYQKILKDQDPIPLYGLKLLNHLVEQNSTFLQNLIPLFQTLFSFFELEHKNNNVHNVRLVLKIVNFVPWYTPKFDNNTGINKLIFEQDESTLINGKTFIQRLNEIFVYAYTNAIESFYEPCIGIVDHLLYIESKLIKDCQKNKNLKVDAEKMYHTNQNLLKNLNVYLSLIDYKSDLAIVEVVGHVLSLISQLYENTHDFIINNAMLKYVSILKRWNDKEIIMYLTLKTIFLLFKDKDLKQYKNLKSVRKVLEILKQFDQNVIFQGRVQSMCRKIIDLFLVGGKKMKKLTPTSSDFNKQKSIGDLLA